MKHIGLVLSGGMGKGAYQIGALSAIREFFHPSDFAYVSAASIGVLNTYAYLTENMDCAAEQWKAVNIQGGKRFITSALKSSFMEQIIQNILTETAVPTNFYVPLLDLSNKDLLYYNFSEISYPEIGEYLKASVAMPLYNKGIPIGRKVLYDGAVVDNIPIFPVLKNDPDYVICIYFDDRHYIFEDHERDKKIIKLTFPDNKIVSNSVYLKHESILYMMEEGYSQTKEVLSSVFAEGTDNFPVIYRKIEERNAADSKRKVHLNGDIVVTNMNRFLKRFVRHQKITEETPDGCGE